MVVREALGVAISIARGLGTDVQDLLGGFKGLTPLGLEAGRICDGLPAQMQSVVIDLLRAAHRMVDGAADVGTEVAVVDRPEDR